MAMEKNFSAVQEEPSDKEVISKKSLKSQWMWMVILWFGGVFSLYLFVKIAKVIMSLVGLGASP